MLAFIGGLIVGSLVTIFALSLCNVSGRSEVEAELLRVTQELLKLKEQNGDNE